MKSDARRILEGPGYEPGDLTELVRQIREIGRAHFEHGGTSPLPLLSRPVMLRMLAELRKELQAVRKARVSLERLARSRNLRERHFLVPPARASRQKQAGRPALFLVQTK
jgi:hypothetical protein